MDSKLLFAVEARRMRLKYGPCFDEVAEHAISIIRAVGPWKWTPEEFYMVCDLGNEMRKVEGGDNRPHEG